MSMTVPEFSVQPWIPWPTDIDDQASLVFDALLADQRAVGPVIGVDLDRGRLEAIFQVEIDEPADVAHATIVASDVFDAALARAGVTTRTTGVAVVAGGDPDQLP